MQHAQRLLAKQWGPLSARQNNVPSPTFSPGGTHVLADEFAGIDDFGVIAFPTPSGGPMIATELIAALQLPPNARGCGTKTLLLGRGSSGCG